MDMLTITFDQAYREVALREFITKLGGIAERMGILRKMAKIAGVYRAARCKEHGQSDERERFLVPNIWELRNHGGSMQDCPSFDQLCQEVCTWLSEKFPFLEDPSYEQWTYRDYDNIYIYITNPGLDLCWDEAAEMFEEPRNFSQDYGLMMFAIYVIFFRQFIGEDQELPSFWDPAAEWFKWGVEMPWWLWLPDGTWRTDNRKFYRLLEKTGLSDVADTFRIAWHDTGTFFLDLENQDGYYGDDTLQEFSVENIERLSKLWNEARPIYARGFDACQKVYEHPETYKIIVNLLGRCIIPGDKKISPKELRKAAAENKRLAVIAPEGDSQKEVEDAEE